MTELAKKYKQARDKFSLYIRLKECGVCFTCGKRFPIAECDCGHFVHGGLGKYSYFLDFEEMNNHCQCQTCNRSLNGNLAIYEDRLRTLYGCKAVEELEHKRWQVVEFTVDDLREKAKYYGTLIKELQR